MSSDLRDADAVARLVHDGFVESGFMAPRPSGRRVIGPYLNPGVAFTVCRAGDSVAGGGVAIPDGPFGIPSDNAFPDLVGEWRDQGRVVIEGGSLVIPPRWRRNRRRIMSLLTVALLRFAAQVDPDPIIVMSAHPRNTGLYGSLMGLITRNDSPRNLFGAPADFLARPWSEVIAHLRAAQGRTQREILEDTVAIDPDWFELSPSTEPLPAHWVTPLAAEDPQIKRLEDQLRLIRGRRGAARVGAARPDGAGLRIVS